MYTPQAEFGDLTGLAALPAVRLETSAAVEQPADAKEGKAHIRVKNPSNGVAFQVRLRLASKTGVEVVPVFWDDNYFSLLPGEERLISVGYDTAQLHGAHPVIQVGGFNIQAAEIPSGPSH